MNQLELAIIGFFFSLLIVLFLSYWFYCVKSKGLGVRKGG